ncbi:pirin family protein, partial [bacterium]|nr:pirin family protein [bacterium]
LLHTEKDNPLELFQIWLNLPAKNKLVSPYFRMLWNEEIPLVTEKDAQGNEIKIKVMAGNYKEHKAPKPTPDSWAADPDNKVGIYKITLSPGAKFTLGATDAGTNRSLYFFKGNKIQVAQQPLDYYKCVDLNAEVDVLIENGDEEAQLLVLQGKPIAEKVVQYGPFVMNSEREIQEAYEDFRRTQWGGWPWPDYENVHDKSRGRFALHADGRLEER